MGVHPGSFAVCLREGTGGDGNLDSGVEERVSRERVCQAALRSVSLQRRQRGG